MGGAGCAAGAIGAGGGAKNTIGIGGVSTGGFSAARPARKMRPAAIAACIATAEAIERALNRASAVRAGSLAVLNC